METTSHKPYVRYEDGDIYPVFAFRQSSRGTVPLVADGNSLVEAQNYRDTDFEIISQSALDVSQNGEVNSKQVLHG